MSNQSYPDHMTDEPQFFDVSPSERQWGMFAHLSALVAIWLGGMAFLGPLIIWLIKKDEMRFVDDQGKEALNFHLSLILLAVVLGVIAWPFVILTLGLGIVPLLVVSAVVGGLVVVMPIIAAIKVNSGETYRYPLIIRLIK